MWCSATANAANISEKRMPLSTPKSRRPSPQASPPIFCIGETKDERLGGILEPVLEIQLKGGLKDLTPEEVSNLVIAYEPVWAIGTGLTATSKEAQEAHSFIRKVISDVFGADAAAKVRIQYGGSVKPENVEELMAQPDIDGALVGGASLKPESFAALVTSAK